MKQSTTRAQRTAAPAHGAAKPTEVEQRGSAVDDILYGTTPKEPEPVSRPQTTQSERREILRAKYLEKHDRTAAAGMEHKPIQNNALGFGASSEFVKPKEVMPTIAMTAPRQQPQISLADFDERAKTSMIPALSKSKTQTEVPSLYPRRASPSVGTLLNPSLPTTPNAKLKTHPPSPASVKTARPTSPSAPLPRGYLRPLTPPSQSPNPHPKLRPRRNPSPPQSPMSRTESGTEERGVPLKKRREGRGLGRQAQEVRGR